MHLFLPKLTRDFLPLGMAQKQTSCQTRRTLWFHTADATHTLCGEKNISNTVQPCEPAIAERTSSDVEYYYQIFTCDTECFCAFFHYVYLFEWFCGVNIFYLSLCDICDISFFSFFLFQFSKCRQIVSYAVYNSMLQIAK